MLEQVSGLVWKQDFNVGYSPERINPGDKTHRFETIIKVVSGDTAESLDLVAETYAAVVTAGVHRAPTIKTAEAAKVIENSQRDLNIAFVNELSQIFSLMDIDTHAVLQAAGTKWNFLPFTPGLVGGHCIGVDPYYLTHKAEQLGHHSQVILAGRRINDLMGEHIARACIKAILKNGTHGNPRVTILGLTFKEDVPDLRNSKVVDIIDALKDFNVTVQVHDPLADPAEALAEYGLSLKNIEELEPADAVILAVPHQFYKSMDLNRLAGLLKSRSGCIMDIKAVLPTDVLADTITLWRP